MKKQNFENINGCGCLSTIIVLGIMLIFGWFISIIAAIIIFIILLIYFGIRPIIKYFDRHVK